MVGQAVGGEKNVARVYGGIESREKFGNSEGKGERQEAVASVRVSLFAGDEAAFVVVAPSKRDGTNKPVVVSMSWHWVASSNVSAVSFTFIFKHEGDYST
jgi:hypothetical protein